MSITGPCAMNGLALQDRPYDPPASWRIALPHSAAAVPVARALVRTALSEVEHGADSDTAELLTAELVANAVEHTAAGDVPIELVVELRPTGCQIEVHDHDPLPPGDLTRPSGGEPDPWQEHGRGLLLIRALSSSCGHRPTEKGKAVWFRLSAVPPQRGPLPM
ncbi:ATP-binding protein [Streptomyces phaeofaciens JCM 4814]|uniref:ATP-binding protein n=1 Tax=Streptomyces phaeofaciens TaxID=68254 RepID=A0A918HLR9_9ACTN|nr:ATP-binding protein [Streptomyces phaeofaciens]